MVLAKAQTIAKEESSEGRAVARMSIRNATTGYFTSVGGITEALFIRTLEVLNEMHNGINVTVQGNKMTAGR